MSTQLGLAIAGAITASRAKVNSTSTKSGNKIFPLGGMVINNDTKDESYTYVTISKDQETYFAKAPIMGIRITQSVDYSMVKTLAGNFRLLTFLDHPVVIQLLGLQCLLKVCNSDGKDTLSLMYDKYKASAKDWKTVDITVGNIAYKAAIISMVQDTDNSNPGVLTYNITLYGVKNSNGK